MILSGTVRGTVVAAERYEVHGQPNWRIVWRVVDGGATGDGAVSEALLPLEQVLGDPRPGAAADVTVVLGSAVAIRVAAG